MCGIVSLLDSTHHALVENLWAELRRRFDVGLADSGQVHYPHFSYHVAEQYDLDKLVPLLHQLVMRTTPFEVQATGLGIFTGEKPVLYVPVARQRPLLNLHETLWPLVDEHAQETQTYYAPPIWFPHITLVGIDLAEDSLAPMLRWLNQQPLNWSITVNNLTILSDVVGFSSMYRLDFGR